MPSQERDLESSRTRGNAELKGNPHMQVSAGKEKGLRNQIFRAELVDNRPGQYDKISPQPASS